MAFRAPEHRSELECAISKRGRRLLAAQSDAFSGGVELPNLSVMSSQGDLMIERLPDYRMIYMESPNQTVIRTGTEAELTEALEIIDRAMVLEDLADV